MKNKRKYKIIKEGDRQYILASEVPNFAKEYFSTSFGIPSYRTIRYYVTNKIINRPQRLGKEAYFEIEYIIKILELIRVLREQGVSIDEIREKIAKIATYKRFLSENYLEKIEEMKRKSIAYYKKMGATIEKKIEKERERRRAKGKP